MSTASLSIPVVHDRRSATAPAPKAWRPPVLIGDSVTPMAGSTMLHLLMRQDAGSVDEDQP